MTQPKPPQSSPGRIMDMANAFQSSAVLLTATELGLFRQLAATPDASVEAMAQALLLNVRAARMLLDSCCALGLIVKTDAALYRNSPEAGAFLVPGQPGDISKALMYNRSIYPMWGQLGQFVRSGAPVQPPQTHLGQSPEATRGFVMAMYGRAMAMAPAIIPHLNLQGKQRLLDLACGPGVFSVMAATQNPELCCTLLDLPPILDVTEGLIAQAPCQQRLTLLRGDYHHTPFPGDMDVVTIFGALHQESEADIVSILTRAYGALKPGGVVYVLDMMTDSSRTQPTFSTLFSLTMALTTSNGWVFSDTDLNGWMKQAGFVHFSCKALPAPLPHWLAMATKSGV